MACRDIRRPSLFSSFSRPFPKVDFLRILVALWLAFGSLLGPLGSLLLPLGSLLVAFGSLWDPFCSLLAPFGSLLVHFSLLLVHFWPPLAHFCYLLASFFLFFCIFDENVVQHRFLMHFSLKITFSVNQIVVSRSVPNAPQQKIHPLFCNPSSRARSGTFASGNLD